MPQLNQTLPENAEALPEPAHMRQWLYWSVAALTAMLLPAFFHIEPWALLLIVGLIVWRLSHAWLQLPLPGRTLRALLALVSVAAIWYSYGTLLGIVAGSALLVVMAGLKLIESRTRRDYFLVLLIALFIGLANFLYAPSAGLAAYTVPALWLTITALLIINHGDHDLSGRRAARLSMGLLLPAVPFAIILFFVFPRVAMSFWQIQPSGVATSGIGNSMAPGSISRLVESSRVAFRVHFDTPLPASFHKPYYWRGPVLHYFAQGVWTRGNTHVPPPSITFKGQPVHYTVMLEPDNHDWLYALMVPARWPANAMLASDFTLYTKKKIHHQLQYTITSYPQARYGVHLPRRNRIRDLQLPPVGNPKARALAAQWRHNLDSSRAIVQRALEWFAHGDYYYTLTPPPLGVNGIDQFLFRTKRGFCEHYASAFAFLMRAAGIPTHVVIGYVGGGRNPIDGYWVIRDTRAHAWDEVWLPKAGWVRVDPTAALPPDHVEPGTAATVGSTLTGGRPSVSWLHNLSYVWGATTTFWNRWVMSYGPTLQKATFAHLGIDYRNWINIALTMLAAFALAIAGIGLWQTRRFWRRRPQRVVQLYAKYCRKLARVGVVRKTNEGPLDFSARAKQARPQDARMIDTVTQLYTKLRYGHTTPSRNTLQQFASAVAGFHPKRHT